MTEKFKAEVGSYSSVVGVPIILRDANGVVIGQLKLTGFDPDPTGPIMSREAYKEAAIDFAERITAAINAGQPERQVKHLKRDQVYDVMAGAALFQVSNGTASVAGNPARVVWDGMPVVTYRNPELGMTFVRFPDEFEDPTRFEKV